MDVDVSPIAVDSCQHPQEQCQDAGDFSDSFLSQLPSALSFLDSDISASDIMQFDSSLFDLLDDVPMQEVLTSFVNDEDVSNNHDFSLPEQDISPQQKRRRTALDDQDFR